MHISSSIYVRSMLHLHLRTLVEKLLHKAEIHNRTRLLSATRRSMNPSSSSVILRSTTHGKRVYVLRMIRWTEEPLCQQVMAIIHELKVGSIRAKCERFVLARGLCIDVRCRVYGNRTSNMELDGQKVRRKIRLKTRGKIFSWGQRHVLLISSRENKWTKKFIIGI